jgi:hypothetical protein
MIIGGESVTTREDIPEGTAERATSDGIPSGSASSPARSSAPRMWAERAYRDLVCLNDPIPREATSPPSSS